MNQVQMAAKLYECRDTVKSLAKMQNEDYNKVLEPYTQILNQVKESKKMDTIPALLEVSKSKTYQQSGMVQLLFMAATIEIIEPSN